jgi:hypothetical protein
MNGCAVNRCELRGHPQKPALFRVIGVAFGALAFVQTLKANQSEKRTELFKP